MRARAALASVPGKLILMGEHAAVYGRPALVAAVGLRASVRVRPIDGRQVRLELRDLDHRATVSWPDLIDYATRARVAWEEYDRRPEPGGFGALAAEDPAHLVKIALGEAAGELGTDSAPGLEVEVRSELPVGSGFGSSAAIAVGVLAATLTALDGSQERSTLDRLALEVERRQHGTPSGADHNTVLRGGVLELRRAPEGTLTVRPVAAAERALGRFAVLHSGEPAESTGAMVAAVRELRRRDPAGFERLLDRMTANVVSFAGQLVERAPDWQRIAEAMVDYQECLEAIGVVPRDVRRALAGARAAGFAAKVSGAGGLSAAGAGSLLVLRAEGGEELPPVLSAYTRYRVALGVPGLSVEVDA